MRRSIDLRRREVTLAFGCLAAVSSGACGSKTAAVDAAMDLSSGEVPELGGGGHSSCPTNLAGPAMTRVPWSGGVAFCIDSTEVTNAQYQAFLATAAAPMAPGTRCQWNTSYAPATTGAGCGAFDPIGHADYPVACIDWCDADAYCKAVGKYLCGAASLDGNPAGPVTNPVAPAGSEWIIACTNDGKSTYPYGSEAKDGRCVDKKFPSTVPGVQPVKTATMCEGGVPGLFDMAGNVSEWQDNCVVAKSSTDGKDDECDAYGGAQSSDYVDTSCTAATSASDIAAHFTRAQFGSDNGFRCCADAIFF